MNKRTIVVTGASAGIGRELAILAASDGFAVLLVARRADRMHAIVNGIVQAGGTAASVALDVTARDAAHRIVAAASGTFGRIDVLVNNAGAGVSGALLAQSDAAVDRQWQLHVAAPLRIARAALPQIAGVKGQLVFIGSGLARVPLANYGAYAAAKAAIRAAAIQLRRELRSRGVAVTYVDPGVVATEFHGAMGVRRSSRIAAATPQHVAAAILRGIVGRAATVNAVPWQTAGSIALEWLGTLADPILARVATEVDSAPIAQPVESVADPAPVASSLEAALEPVARRMERVGLPIAFLQSILQSGVTLELNDVAMRWAGMPNKNERAALRDVFDALCAAGYLQAIGEERFTVVHGV